MQVKFSSCLFWPGAALGPFSETVGFPGKRPGGLLPPKAPPVAEASRMAGALWESQHRMGLARRGRQGCFPAASQGLGAENSPSSDRAPEAASFWILEKEGMMMGIWARRPPGPWGAASLTSVFSDTWLHPSGLSLPSWKWRGHTLRRLPGKAYERRACKEQ